MIFRLILSFLFNRKRARRCTFFYTIGNCDDVKHSKENLRQQILWKRARRSTFFIRFFKMRSARIPLGTRAIMKNSFNSFFAVTII